MNAVILCAGRGLRLHPLTRTTPKCLLEIGERALLDHAIANLRSAGIRTITLVTGFQADRIERWVSDRGFDNIGFVHNDRFATTNTAYSFNLALADRHEDFLLINGDVLFDPQIAANLTIHPEPNCVVVDRDAKLDAEAVKVVNGAMHVSRIGKDLEPGNCLGEAIGVNKISASAIPALQQTYDELEAEGRLDEFFEAGIDRLTRNGNRFGILVTDRPWAEIDTPEDLHHARSNVYPRLYA